MVRPLLPVIVAPQPFLYIRICTMACMPTNRPHPAVTLDQQGTITSSTAPKGAVQFMLSTTAWFREHSFYIGEDNWDQAENNVLSWQCATTWQCYAAVYENKQKVPLHCPWCVMFRRQSMFKFWLPLFLNSRNRNQAVALKAWVIEPQLQFVFCRMYHQMRW